MRLKRVTVCGRRVLGDRSDTYDVFVCDYFEEQHEYCDEMEEVSDELKDVHIYVLFIL
jgi:hypothetical protein